MNAIAGLDEEGFRARGSAGASTVAELLAALLLTEQRLAEHTQSTTRTVESSEEERRTLAKRTAVPQVIHGLLARRRETQRLVERSASEQLAPLAQTVQRIVEYEGEQVARIRELRAGRITPPA